MHASNGNIDSATYTEDCRSNIYSTLPRTRKKQHLCNIILRHIFQRYWIMKRNLAVKFSTDTGGEQLLSTKKSYANLNDFDISVPLA